MAEKTVLVCDVCGAEPARTVSLLVGVSSWRKDLCQAHLGELLEGARKPGRRTKGRSSPRRQSSGPPRMHRKATSGGRRRSTQAVAAQARKLRDSGLSYRQIGEALIKQGIRPPRAKAWNRVVIGRMLKSAAA